MTLSFKHQQFVTEYLECWNATEAYQRVYKKAKEDSARANGATLLANASISAEVQRRIAEKAMTADEVLIRLAKHARGDIDDYLNDDGHFDLAKARKAKKTGLIKKLKTRRTTYTANEIEHVVIETEFELYDAQAALVNLGRGHKLFTDKSEVTADVELKDVSDTERRIVGKLDSLAARISAATASVGVSADPPGTTSS